jgi:hypothetical protein
MRSARRAISGRLEPAHSEHGRSDTLADVSGSTANDICPVDAQPRVFGIGVIGLPSSPVSGIGVIVNVPSSDEYAGFV